MTENQLKKDAAFFASEKIRLAKQRFHRNSCLSLRTCDLDKKLHYARLAEKAWAEMRQAKLDVFDNEDKYFNENKHLI